MPPSKKKIMPVMYWNKPEIMSIKHDYTSETDRLSFLPDSLLITILSLVPIHSAAATSVLSHRWRYLWTQITHISFEPCMGRMCRKPFRSFRGFKNTVNHILFQLSSSKLHTFRLNFPFPNTLLQEQQTDDTTTFYSELRDCIACIVPWIELVSHRNPEAIIVTFHDSNTIRLPHLPVSFLQTQSLVTLKLIANVELNFPKDNLQVNLPNLKKLHMNLFDSQRCVMDTLFRSCPLLEHLLLSLRLNELDHLIHISAPNLKDLDINLEESSLLSIHTKFVVNAPKLERFEVRGLLAVYDFVTNPTNLRHVIFILQKIDGFIIDHVFVNTRQGLFRGISCVRNLVLVGDCGITISLLDFVAGINGLPIYHNLVYLHLNCGESDVDFVDNNWRPQLPSFWSANLKSINV
ncbi:putative F-box/FBD/LRR-repeat protein At5g44950 [Chenopodium quinoa]|uniref:putative F-box/FBD/LRR-repeat protein At5g44950 n=1 Tax=Chenopodium quinoa TaxID=63459 RepID=UPI000B76E761|nr:putative F-box/FBD/LRR-repeat protein At5g44950 [Chenopodium quinoa]